MRRTVEIRDGLVTHDSRWRNEVTA
jgi:hypothetical protein